MTPTTLSPGTRLGPYEILGLLGVGGMGEVYRARDARLGRAVAIKLIATAFRGVSDGVRRFEQEARAAAALNHPNILAVHDIGEHEGSPYIVSELLEGETLRERLAAPPSASAPGQNGAALPVRKAVEYAIQVAHGLAAAHEKGIVHRDLKPENLFVTTDDRVKILDFGLAKLVAPEASYATTLPTAAAETRAGVVLGTIGYMAPEQVRGVAADHRADLFALGAILHEMLAGTRAFNCETAAETMTAILKDEPPELPTDARRIPPALARIVERCLAKSPGARFASAADLAFALESLSTLPSPSGQSDALATTASSHTRGRWAIGAGVLALGVLLGAGAMALLPRVRSQATAAAEPKPVFLSLTVPETLSVIPSQPPAVSPDGTRVAFVALDRESGKHSIYVRPLGSDTTTPVQGTERGVFPFWSGDGRQLAFFADGLLRTADLTTGSVRNLCLVPNPFGPGIWVNDTIVFSRSVGPVNQVASTGGTPVPAAPFASRGNAQSAIGFLADHNRFIFGLEGSGGLAIGAIDRPSAEPLSADITKAFLQAPWLRAPAETNGHLLFLRDTTLLAQPIDGGGRIAGPVTPIAQGVSAFPLGSGALVSAQETVLAYVSGVASATQLVVVDRRGTVATQAGTMTGVFRDPSFSPQGAGSLLTVSHFNEADRVYDLLRVNLKGNTTSRLTHGVSVLQASWIPGRDELVATTAAKGASTISRVRPTEGAPLIPLLQTPVDSVATQPQISRDGLTLMYGRNDGAEGNTKIYVSPIANTGESRRWLDTPTHEYSAHFSPDGRWVAYSTNDTDKGSVEVFVRSFSDPREKQQISRGGGYRPVWSPVWKGDGGELFFLTPDGDLMAAKIHTSPALTVDPPKRLFRTKLDPGVLLTFYQYDVAPDGEHFVIVQPVSDVPPSINVILNWQALLSGVPSRSAAGR